MFVCTDGKKVGDFKDPLPPPQVLGGNGKASSEQMSGLDAQVRHWTLCTWDGYIIPVPPA